MSWSSKWPDALPPVTSITLGVDVGKGDDVSILTIMGGNKKRVINAQIIGGLALDFDDATAGIFITCLH